MRGERTVRLIRAKAEPVKTTSTAVASWDGVDRGLFEHLRGVRRELAEQNGVPAFVIFSDRTLRDLARRRPTRPTLLRQVHGVGDAKLTQFGDRFLAEIKSYCSAHDLSADVVDDPTGSGSDECLSPSTSTRATRAGGRVSRTKRAAFDLFSKGASMDDVMVSLARARSTVANYLSEFIETTRPASIERWVAKETYAAVARAAGEVGTDRLKPIFERLDTKVSYEDIRLVVTHLEVHD